MKRRFVATVDGQEIEFFVESGAGPTVTITRAGRDRTLSVDRIGDSHYLVLQDGKVHHLGFTRQGREWQAYHAGEVLTFDLKDEKAITRGRLSGSSTGSTAGDVVSPMPGRVVKILVEIGQAIKSGQPVAVVEAMKMENEFKVKRDGTVKDIKVKPGDTVEGGTVLVVVE